jgi:decaprenyl-phosphate phosphoribosyltransferase
MAQTIDAPSLAVALVRAARPRQWLKNVLVLAAPAAAGVIFHGDVTWRVAVAFVAFCVTASGLYLLNDVADIDVDRLHPRKQHRPIAAGIVKLSTARAVGVACVVIGMVVSAATGRWWLVGVLGAYVALTLSYSSWLKHVAVIDLMAIALGFVLRSFAGAAAAHVRLSNWFVIFTSFGSLFVVAGKRLAELNELADNGQDAGRVRATLETYRPAYLRMMIGVALAVTTVSYCVWAFERAALHTSRWHWFELSIIPMVAALFRYALLLDNGQGSAPEDLFTTDRTLQSLGLVWLVLFALGVHVG